MDAKQFLAEFGYIANAPNGVQRLREMIYQLAVTGGLSANEGQNGQELLESIKERRKELIRRKKYKRMPKLEKEGIDTIKSIHIPAYWTWTRLLDIGEISPKNKFENEDEEIPADFLPMRGVSDLHKAALQSEVRSWDKIKKGYTHFANNDVTVAKITPCFENGKAAIIRGLKSDSGIGAGTTELHVFRPIHEGVLPDYVYIFLRSPYFRVKGESSMTGTAGQKRLPTAFFATYPFPLPPTKEQSLIVTKVDELMALCDKLETQQQQKRKLQNQLHQATLQAVANAESPKALQDSWERLADNLSHFFAKPADVLTARQLIKKLAISGFLIVEKETPLSSIELSQKSSIPWQVPSTWNWLQTTKLGDSRLGKMLDKSKNTGELRPYLRSVNVRWGKFDLTSLLEMKVEDEELDRVSVKKGDLVICEGGEPGRAAIWNSDEKFVIQKALHRFRCCKEIITAEYLLLCLEHDFYSGRLVEFYTGATIKHLTGKSLAKYSVPVPVPVPVPPLKQQKKIVKRVNELMQYCDTLENQLRSANKTAENLATAAISSLTGITTQQQEEPMKAPKTELKAPVRLGNSKPSNNSQAPLATLLTRHNGELSANDLWQRFGGEIDAFYAQLKTEVRKGWIAEPFDNDDGKTKPHHVILEKEAD